MNKDEFAKLVENTIEEGGLLAMLYFDIHGPDPEGLKGTMAEFISKLSGVEGVVYSFGEIQPPLKMEDEELYSTMSEVYVLAKDFPTLSFISLNYSPVSIDIMKPEKDFKMSVTDIEKTLGRLAHFSLTFTSTYLTKVLKPEEREKYLKKLRFREERGKEMLKKSGVNKHE